MIEHWSEVDDLWPARLASVARAIPRGSRIIDLGAGAQGLRYHVERRDCVYTPADLMARSDDTLVFDMNGGAWPEGRWDMAAMVGILEYATDPVDALRHVHDLAPAAVVTYAHRRSRKAIASGLFRNDLTPHELRGAALDAGWWQATHVRDWHHGMAGKQAVWVLR